MNKKEYKRNLAYLEEKGLCLCCEKVWEDHPWSVELETRTDAGEDIFIALEEPTEEYLQKYIDNFNINENVVLWWPNGIKNNGVPFDNIRDHYNDYESFIKRLQGICDNWPE